MKKNWKAELAKRVTGGRGEMSQAQLAFRAGISDRTISLIENMKLSVEPRPKTVIRLALAVGNDPLKWLAIFGDTASPELIENIRANLVTSGRMDSIEPRLTRSFDQNSGQNGSPQMPRQNSEQSDIWKALYDLRVHFDRRLDEILKRLEKEE